IDLPLVWGGIIALAVFLYVLLDGFDLGCGILFPFAPTDNCRNRMMNSIAPFWDGNETWLVLGGGGLFAAFPLAYAILMPAFYLPIFLMLVGLIFRGVAFEFRFKAETSRWIWDHAFHFGSLLATFMQGVVLGTYVQGIKVTGRAFGGSVFDSFTGFSMLTGAALVAGYALLGATWLIMKTEGETAAWARRTAHYVLLFVGIFMALVSLCVPFTSPEIARIWFTLPNIFYLSPVPVIAGITLVVLYRKIHKDGHVAPYLLTNFLFVLGYIGLAISLWPYVVPRRIDLWQAAAAPQSLSLLLIGVALFLPVVLGYTAYCYYIFRGKADVESLY
ncbi:MAG: cytochrome subunit, partial [Alphaproteobacteria bacterium]|nr:cytochrome subunit [Alphaproteobacteria bacterium]